MSGHLQSADPPPPSPGTWRRSRRRPHVKQRLAQFDPFRCSECRAALYETSSAASGTLPTVQVQLYPYV